MQYERALAARHLLHALIESNRPKTMRPPMPTLLSEREDSSPFTLREGLFHEPKTMPGFSRVRSKAR